MKKMKKTSLVFAVVLGLFMMFTIAANVLSSGDCGQVYRVDGDQNKLVGDQHPLAEGIVIAEADSCTLTQPDSNGCIKGTCVDSKGDLYCITCCAVVTSTGTYTNSCGPHEKCN